MTKEKENKEIALIDWLNYKDELVKLFGESKINRAMHYLSITKEDLTHKEDFESYPHHLTCEVLNDKKYSNHIKVYADVGGVAMEGYKSGSVFECRVSNTYQSDYTTKIVEYLLKKAVPYAFEGFQWSIYGNSVSNNYEIYLKTELKHKSFNSELSLYVPVKALLNKDVEAIKERNTSYWKDYCKSSYSLNKKKGETFEEFNVRKDKERDEYLEVFNSEYVKELFALLETNK